INEQALSHAKTSWEKKYFSSKGLELVGIRSPVDSMGSIDAAGKTRLPDKSIFFSGRGPRVGTLELKLPRNLTQLGNYFHRYNGPANYQLSFLGQAPAMAQDCYAVAIMQFDPDQFIYKLRIVLAYRSPKEWDSYRGTEKWRPSSLLLS